MDESEEISRRMAMIITTSRMQSMGDTVRQEEMCRQFCSKHGMFPAVTVRVTGVVSAEAIGQDTWNLARSHDVRHVVLFKASVVDWRVAELFLEFGDKLCEIYTLSFVVDGFHYDGSASPFKPVDGMETMLRCVLRDVLDDAGGGAVVPRAPSVASQCLLDRYLVPFGGLLAMYNHFTGVHSQVPSARLEASRGRSVRRAIFHGYADTGTYNQMLAEARRHDVRRRRRQDRFDLLAVCRSLDCMTLDDDE
ncbi:hypothetical protein BVTX09c1_016 [Bovine papular stomatitis virus]|uniref:Protein OPG061 n=1 Tax=Bovine papular stomatitis virus TaxID=129727 RepID=A0A0E3T6X1_9POXV|nr:hypothetical protein BVTX09c1_016 [Bovine papular stomatitis virus]